MWSYFKMSNHDAFISLIRLGIGHYIESSPQPKDWLYIKEQSERHGLQAIVVDGIDKMPDSQKPPKEILLQWIGNLIVSYENRYELYRRTIAEMAHFYNSHGYKIMVLKGYACCLDWPKPEHRPCGDIDIWVFGKQKETDSLAVREKGIKIDKSHHHHTIFEWNGFIVENHYDFVNVHGRRSSAEIEKVLKVLGDEANLNKKDNNISVGNRIPSIDVCGEKIYLPSPNLHALFLIRHMVSHFAAAEISLRHVLDWAFLVEKHSKEIDWSWLVAEVEKYHMKDFFNCINAICVDNLGFQTSIFPIIHFLPELKEKVLNDILDPVYGAKEPTRLMSRIVYKYRRWQGNAWKQKLCYGESRTCAFWRGGWSHLIKPKSI